jgi:uncharacterized protein (DUF2336 family)
MPILQESVIDELETAIRDGSSERRIETLRRITDLFLEQSDRLNDEQIGLFDNVLGHFVERIESRALAELSDRLARIENAPLDVVRSLARHEEIAVAGPVLAESSRLTTSDLVEIARIRGQDHLLAISGRDELEDRLTDVLLMRGNSDVMHKVATNGGSQISAVGFAALVRASENDERLAEATGIRGDLPVTLLRELMSRAAESVREKLLAQAPVHVRREISAVLAEITTRMDEEATRPRDFTKAQKFVELMHSNGELDEATLIGFATGRKYEETVAALAALSETTIDIVKPLMKSARFEGLLVPCRAAHLRWPAVRAVLECRIMPALGKEALAQAEVEYNKLTAPSAQRLLRFWKVREASGRTAAG